MGRLLFGILVLAGGVAHLPAGQPLESNRLWIRDARAVNAPWQPIGRAQRLVAMAMLNGRLYGASVAYYILQREASPGDAGWTIIGDAWLISAMTALDGHLYVANRDGLVGVSRPVRNMYFNKIGELRGVVAMAALDRNIYAVTSDGRLLAWEDAAHTPFRWIQIGRADRVTALAALDGQLYAATSDNRLFARETALQDRAWKLIGHAENVTAMTAFDGKLYAAAYSPWLVGIPSASTTCVLWETNRLYSEARNFLRAAKQAGRIKDRQECLRLAGDSQALQKQAGGQQLADLIAGSCARCACASEF